MAALSTQPDEDWEDFNEFTSASVASPEPVKCCTGEPGPDRESSAFWSGVESAVPAESSSWSSVHNLVQDFEQKLSLCFINNYPETENISDIKPITEEHLLREDE